MDKPLYFIGIDIAKLKFDVAVKTSAKQYDCMQFSNDQSGFKALSAWLPNHGKCYIVMEATNIYHEALCDYLYHLGHAVVVINPKCSVNLAKGLNIRSKNDKVDAKLLARMGQSHHEEFHLWSPKSKQEQALLRQLRHLEYLKQLKAQNKVRLQTIQDAIAMKCCGIIISY